MTESRDKFAEKRKILKGKIQISRLFILFLLVWTPLFGGSFFSVQTKVLGQNYDFPLEYLTYKFYNATGFTRNWTTHSTFNFNLSVTDVNGSLISFQTSSLPEPVTIGPNWTEGENFRIENASDQLPEVVSYYWKTITDEEGTHVVDVGFRMKPFMSWMDVNESLMLSHVNASFNRDRVSSSMLPIYDTLFAEGTDLSISSPGVCGLTIAIRLIPLEFWDGSQWHNIHRNLTWLVHSAPLWYLAAGDIPDEAYFVNEVAYIAGDFRPEGTITPGNTFYKTCSLRCVTFQPPTSPTPTGWQDITLMLIILASIASIYSIRCFKGRFRFRS